MKYILFCLVSVFSLTVSAASVTEQFAVKRQIALDVTTSNVVALQQNINRVYLLVQNLGASIVYLKVGSAITALEGVQIPANGGSVEFSVSPTDEIDLKSSLGTDSVIIIEGNAQ